MEKYLAQKGFNKWLSNYSEEHHYLKGWNENDHYLDEVELPDELLFTLIQKWLLEKHGYFVSVELAYNKWGKFSAKIEKLSKDNETAIIALDGLTIFDTPEKALEEGLFETLQLLK